uniref:SJCHGC09448 protein n=1 Tax=Schistosoma japonicum TaxID=6182 RepID=Q86EX4_SCHJA|nr:SJCHGC09448 protein [Schistosoma japonicum]
MQECENCSNINAVGAFQIYGVYERNLGYLGFDLVHRCLLSRTPTVLQLSVPMFLLELALHQCKNQAGRLKQHQI